jgi:peptide/nickel transport system substrate-binding protein
VVKGALTAAVLLAAAAFAAVPVRADKDPTALTYLMSTDVDSLDPSWAYDATSLFVVQQVYENLVEFDGTAVDQFAPRLASVVPSKENGFLSADGLNYSFPLRGGVKFHDGTTMTPDDVKYSVLRFLLTDREGGPSALLLEPLTGRKSTLGADGKPDPAVFDLADKAVSIEGGALTLHLRKPFAPMLAVLAGYAHVVSKSYVASHGGWDGTRETWTRHWNPAKEAAALYEREDGTGPFTLQTWDRAGKTVVLARNESYWRQGPALRTARLETVESPRARRSRLDSGDADVAQIDPRQIGFFENAPGVVVDEVPDVEVSNVVFFNEKIEPDDNEWLGSGALDGAGIPPDFFADVNIRRAFANAFDYDYFIREGYRGRAAKAHGPIPPGLLGYDPRQLGWPFSPDEAAKAFKRARGGQVWEKGFTLPVAYTEGRDDRKLACEILAHDLPLINPLFHVDCRGIPQSKLLDELRARRLGAFVFRWVLDYPDPHNAVEPFLHSDGFFAKALGYSSPRADLLIAQAETELDLAQRRADYAELQAISISDAPMIFTVDAPGALARRANVQNWIYHPMQPYGSLYEVTKLP